jgi:hypothetical protein
MENFGLFWQFYLLRVHSAIFSTVLVCCTKKNLASLTALNTSFKNLILKERVTRKKWANCVDTMCFQNRVMKKVNKTSVAQFFKQKSS